MTQFFLILAILLFFPSSARAAVAPQAIPTFHSIGIYWSPADGSTTNPASIRYRQQGTTIWKDGFPLWYDPRGLAGRPPEYRGSLVHLQPNTTYEIELKLNSGTTTVFTAKTWSENFPISSTKIHPVSNSSTTLNVNDSGTATGYALYAPLSGQAATIDVANNSNYDVNVTASYVIIRGLTLKGAKQHGIYLNPGVHDVVIENNDISGWGQLASSGWGVPLQSAVFANSSSVERIIVQRNKMHHPRYDTNSWLENGHPLGPQAITLVDSAGHHVFRYNTVTSDDDHFFNDIFGAGSDFSYQGFPNRDSDIYANYLERAWDNPIEAEGANMNVRIWGNFIDKSYKPIANTSTSLGPMYIWRNISKDSCYGPCWGSSGTISSDTDKRGAFLKAGSKVNNNIYYGDGKVYLFHNTAIQTSPPTGLSLPLGVSGGIGSGGGTQTGLYGRNNIWYMHKSTDISVGDNNTDTSYLKKNSHDYDLYNGVVQNSSQHEAHGLKGVPIFAADISNRQYPLAPGSLGLNAGVSLPNFNDNSVGAPDLGAYEAGAPPLQFGVTAYLTALPTTTPAPHSADINGDGVINGLDYVVLFENFGHSPFDPRADVNRDGVVNGLDYVLFYEAYGAQRQP